MADRRTFIKAAASGSIGAALVSGAPAVAQVTPAPAATAAVPSVTAAAFAESMTVRFDPHLSASERNALGLAIDANSKAAAALNPKKQRLKNDAAPAVQFSVPDTEP